MSYLVIVHSNRRIGGRHPHKGSGKDKVCLLQREDGDDEESLPVAGMEDLVFRGSRGIEATSDCGSVKGSGTGGSSAANEGSKILRSTTQRVLQNQSSMQQGYYWNTFLAKREC